MDRFHIDWRDWAGTRMHKNLAGRVPLALVPRRACSGVMRLGFHESREFVESRQRQGEGRAVMRAYVLVRRSVIPIYPLGAKLFEAIDDHIKRCGPCFSRGRKQITSWLSLCVLEPRQLRSFESFQPFPFARRKCRRVTSRQQDEVIRPNHPSAVVLHICPLPVCADRLVPPV
jgi:hypothetical protein